LKGFTPALPTGWCCYILLCSDGSYYCGMSSNLAKRMTHHSTGRGSGYTKKIAPRALVWYEFLTTRQRAAAREKQIKTWSSVKKTILIHGKSASFCFGTRVWMSLSSLG